MKSKTFTLSALSFLLLGACASYPVPRYSVSVANVQAFKNLGQKIAVQPVKWVAEGSHQNFQCRAAGPIETSENVKFENYVQKAIEDELILAEKLSDKGKKLQIVINYMDVDTEDSFWKIDSTVTFGNKTFQHSSQTTFDGGFFADNACKGAANSYIAAIQDFTKSLIPKLAEQRGVKVGDATMP